MTKNIEKIEQLQESGIHTESKFITLMIYIVFLMIVSAIISLAVYKNGASGWPLGLYSTLLLMYLLSKMSLAFMYRPVPIGRDSSHLKISVVIPNYNEEPDALVKTVHSLMKQSRVPDEIFVVDDGSKDERAYYAVLELCKIYPNLTVHRMEKNVGKRRAQGWAFRRVTGDLILTVDSDTLYDFYSIEAMIAPFLRDPRVTAVGGQIRARNRRDNLMTRLLDMRYHNAYRVERAAQSVSGAMLCCSGPIAMYRKDIILDNLDDYENQLFLGEIVTAGDDRRLTQYSLKKGRVVYQGLATCETTIPSSFRVFIKQQVRWTKSFFRESGESLRFAMEVKKMGLLYWTVLELVLWFIFTVSVLWTIFSGKVFSLDAAIITFLYIALAAYARNVFYILKYPHIFLMAPIYGLFHIIVLFPVRIYALINIKNTGWGTR